MSQSQEMKSELSVSVKRRPVLAESKIQSGKMLVFTLSNGKN